EVTGCSRETAAPMGLFAGTCVAHGRFGRRPAWSEPLLPVTLTLPAAGGGKALELAQVGRWSRPEDGRIEQVRRTDSSMGAESPGQTPETQDGSPLRIMRFPDGPDHDPSGPMVALARSARTPGTPPVGFALVGEGAIALTAAATAGLSGGVDAELLAQIVEDAGALGSRLAQALRTDDRRGGPLAPARPSAPRAPVPSPRPALRPEDVGRER
ncbi:MAG: hypothetical protein QG608_513, partial [Actinomycetota bacterium]|nr:hypothetical protein [Actinomycetota bacterium]